ncbi:MAG: helix-turn-helix transcriptional regulator [Bacteroidales bacterium]|nr:helix-turn-helix transcriptional regulator [Bacteroidales bacterium]
MKRNVLIIESSEIIYKGIRDIINSCPQLYALQQIDSISMLDSRIITLHPDIIIANPTLFDLASYDLQEQINNIPKIAFVYQYIRPNILQQYDAIIDIHDSTNKIIHTITNVTLNTSTNESQESNELTEREQDVLILIAKGLMSKEIADTLNISVHTVISHRKNITRKTGIKSIAGLVAYALLNNLLDSTEIE